MRYLLLFVAAMLDLHSKLNGTLVACKLVNCKLVCGHMTLYSFSHIIILLSAVFKSRVSIKWLLKGQIPLLDKNLTHCPCHPCFPESPTHKCILTQARYARPQTPRLMLLVDC